MIRLVPRSLFGRLLVVVLFILISAQLASFALHLYERAELMMQASGMRAAQRIADIVKLLDTIKPDDRARIAKVLSVAPFTVSVDSRAQPPLDSTGMTTRTLLFATMLKRVLGDERPLRARVSELASASLQPDVPAGPMGMGMGMGKGHMADGVPHGPGMMGYFNQPGLALAAQVQLMDGSWVLIESRQGVQAVIWPYRLLGSIAILIVAAIVVAYIAVRWVTRPMQTLATAVQELGRNVNRAPIPETGPTEVAHAAHAFNTMQQQLSDYIRSRTQLLAAMSHDLKTPITRLRLRSEMLDDAKLRERYEQDLRELEAMVGSTLDFLRGIDDGEPAQPFDVMAMIEALQADRAETGERVTVSGHTDRPYSGQRQALRRALGNLLDNAVKYGGNAHVEVDDSEVALAIRIQDNGPGIPENELEKVFDPFYRIEGSRNRETGGTGLGLAIARKIARAHGGDDHLSNRESGGLEALLRVPRGTAR